MPHQVINTDNQAMTLYITITCSGKKKLRIWAEEYGKKNSKYADRECIVDGKRTIYFSLPISPKVICVGAKNVENLTDENFEISIIQVPLKKYDIYIDNDARNFLQFAINFSQMSGFIEPPANGTLYSTADNKFKIKYFPVIIDYQTGNAISTPARIGHSSGIIEVAKCKFDRYTIPMRLVILLHEFSHKYRNPKIGLEISNEFGADINGLYLYLGSGFSKIDAITVFAKVFLKAQSEGNIQRNRRIADYIQRFEAQEYAQLI
ncbi:MAG TPA: hypothetical protein PLN38_04760 [Chitinophagales bacterium]|nr:hypothetical protein [Chitinophagales bacterium]